ncbi:tetrapyrrole methylase [Bordetella pertussis]|nr:tetrapyrrole methylase [Bordetella pertussis]
MFESPHRLAATLADLREAGGPARLLTVARELTKRFEEIATMPLGEAADWLGEDDEADPADPRTDALLDALLESLSVRDAARVAAKVTGLARDVLYARALARKEQP